MNDLDRKAAEVVMGYTQCECCSGYWTEVDSDGKPTEDANFISDWSPSTEIEQALGDGGPGTIVGRMRELGWAFHFHSRAENREMGVGFSREWSSYRNLELYEGIPAAAITEVAVRAVKGETNVG